MSEIQGLTVAEIKAEKKRLHAEFEAEKRRLEQALIVAEVDALEHRCLDAFNDVANDVETAEYQRALARAELSFLRAKKKALTAFATAARIGEHTGEPTE